VYYLAPKSLPKFRDQPESRSYGLGHGPAQADKINRDSGLRERAYLHAVSRRVIFQEIAELEAWADATVIPFPIQMDLWYEFIETV
jgi:hypothetical protein